jgi:hypothetical protein
MKFQVYNRISTMTTKQIFEDREKEKAESTSIGPSTYRGPSTYSYTFPKELIENLKQYIIDNYEAGNVRFDDRDAIELDKDDYINQLLMHMFYAEKEPSHFRVTVDIIVEAEDEADAESKVIDELHTCDFAEVSIDSVYED